MAIRLLFFLVASVVSNAVAASDKMLAAENYAWLQTNSGEEGVVVLPSGLQYKILESGPVEGSKRPSLSDSCTCHYTGTLIDGTVFDSSRNRGAPSTFSPSGVIGAWTEALQLMRPGDRWMLYIPASLGYGDRGAAGGRIPGGATLIFDLELISVSESSGLFAGTPLDHELIPAFHFKLGHVVLLGVFWILYNMSGFWSAGGTDGGRGRHVSASHILVKDMETCLRLQKQLAKEPAAFARVAKEHSTCPSAAKGGELGTFGPDQMVAAFDKVCWSAPVGHVTGPVTTQFGYHLILVTARDDESEAKSK